MKKPTLAQDRIGAHLWSFNFASKLIHGGTSTTMEAHQKHTASTASRPRCAASPGPFRSVACSTRAFEKCSPERCALLLERVGLNRQYTTYVVHGSRIGTSAFRKGALFRAPSVQ
jgi:hypothetical protein